MVLAASCRSDRYQLGEDHEDRYSTEPDDEVAIDNTGRATILEADEEQPVRN